MEHFTSADWVDFARGLLPPEKSNTMEQHLTTGCENCGRTSAFWREVAEIGAREAGFDPPSEAVWAVKNAYRIEKPISRWREWASLARLVFDSALQPAPLAVRAAAASSRQLIHESEPYTIDLRLEPDPARKRIYLTGQVMNAENPQEAPGEIDVVLLRGAEQVARTEAGPTGEFCLDFHPAQGLHLFLNIRGQKAIAIGVPEIET